MYVNTVKLPHRSAGSHARRNTKEPDMRIEDFHDQHPNPSDLSVREWNALVEDGVARAHALRGAAICQAFRALALVPYRVVRRLAIVIPDRRRIRPGGHSRHCAQPHRGAAVSPADLHRSDRPGWRRAA